MSSPWPQKRKTQKANAASNVDYDINGWDSMKGLMVGREEDL